MNITDYFSEEIIEKALALLADDAVEILDEVNGVVQAIITDEESYNITIDIEKIVNGEYDINESEYPVFEAAVFIEYCKENVEDSIIEFVEQLEENEVRDLLTSILLEHPEILIEKGILEGDPSEFDMDDEEFEDDDEYDSIDFMEDLSQDEIREFFQDTVLNPDNCIKDLDNQLDDLEELVFRGSNLKGAKEIILFMDKIIQSNYPENVKKAYLIEVFEDLSMIYDEAEEDDVISMISTFVDENTSKYSKYIDLEEIYLDPFDLSDDDEDEE